MSVLKVYNATKGKWEFVDTVSTGIIPSSVPLVDPKHDQLWLDTSSNDFQGSAINAKLDGIVDNLNLVQPISGSNANGNYTKFPDGTMICTKRIVFQESVLESSGLYFSASEPIADSFLFNTEINLAPSVSVSGYSTQRKTTADGTSSTAGAMIDSTNMRWSVYFVTPPTAGGVIVTLTIIGRWKD